jgi:hypothetical protein
MRVTAVAGTTVTVVRGQATTTAVAHATGKTVTVLPKMTTVATVGGVFATDTSLTLVDPAAVGAAAGVYLRVGGEVLRIVSVAGQVFVCVCSGLIDVALSGFNSRIVCSVAMQKLCVSCMLIGPRRTLFTVGAQRLHVCVHIQSPGSCAADLSRFHFTKTTHYRVMPPAQNLCRKVRNKTLTRRLSPWTEARAALLLSRILRVRA